MSFYIYYGKLGKDLLVAILPNGTVEAEDKLYLSSQNGFFAHRAKEVTVTDKGEDRIVFVDGHATYVAVSKQGYKELEITRTIKTEKVTTTLTRKYEQPKNAITSSTKPQVWTGRLNFHKWAKNEEIVIVAPQGLGNKKPIVSIWQWTEAANKEEGSLSHSVSEQISETKVPTKFTFKQNGYYSVTCAVNATSQGLGLKLKGPPHAGDLNSEVSQQELALAQVSLAAPASLTKPRDIHTKIELECSRPAVKSNLARVLNPLPFPADLIESLQHTAAYLDHAGGLARYANKQFDKLFDEKERLERKVDGKDHEISELNAKAKEAKNANEKLTKENGKLTADLAEAGKKSSDLEAKLQKALKALADAQAREKLDKREDAQREKKWRDHHAEDMKAYQFLEDEFEKAKGTIRSLKTDLHEVTEKYRVTQCDLDEALATNCDLQAHLEYERYQNKLLREKIELMESRLAEMQESLEHLHAEKARLDSRVAVLESQTAELTAERNTLQSKLSAAELSLKKTEAELKKTQTDLKNSQDDVRRLNSELSDSKALVGEKERECERTEKSLKRARDDLADVKAKAKVELDEAKAKAKAELDEVTAKAKVDLDEAIADRDAIDNDKDAAEQRANRRIEDLTKQLEEARKGNAEATPIVDVVKDNVAKVTATEVHADA